MRSLERLIAVVGPTATGKSDLALDLAERYDGEVVNADAMQLYRGMDIGTAKLSLEQRRGIAHHQLDVLEVTETASVAAYQREARRAIEDVLHRGRTPLLVGGSGLYVQAVLDELRFPGTDPAIRADYEQRLAEVGPQELHRQLAQRDPAAGEAILPSNGRRIVRALEVIEMTGQPFTANLPEPGPGRYDVVQVGLERPVDQLDERVDRRVTRMFDAGLVEEVRQLDEVGLRTGRTASRALGYQQVLSALDGGADLDAAIAETAKATRRFVRRQRSWFRRDERIRWFDADRSDLVDEISSTLHVGQVLEP